MREEQFVPREVAKDLKDKGYDVQYNLVGSGAELEKLQDLIVQLQLEDTVFLLGTKDQSEIKSLLESHHLFLMTSTSDEKGRREAFGVVSLEAQSMGLPVIGFKSGGFPETISEGKTGYTVEDRNVEAMSLAIETVINDSLLFESMSMEAVKHVSANFSKENTTDKYIQLYSA
jgi:colanic acid/amylovoran biosynthesis glycosyltransferase